MRTRVTGEAAAWTFGEVFGGRAAAAIVPTELHINAFGGVPPPGDWSGSCQEGQVHQLAMRPLGGTVGDITGRNGRARMTAPLQVIALSFSRDAGSEDRILAEVDRLRGRGVLRLLDMLFVGKTQDGAVERLTIGDDEDFGSLLAAVVPVANGGPAVPAPADGSAAFDPADRWALADSLQPGTAWPSCSSSTAGPARFSTRSPRPAAR